MENKNIVSKDPQTASFKGLAVQYVNSSELIPTEYNPRKWSSKELDDLSQSFTRFGVVEPLLANCAPNRKNVLIGGHMRLVVAKKLGMQTVPVVYVSIADPVKERELNVRLNANTGEWDFALLKEFDEKILADIGFSSEELDEVFHIELDNPEVFDLKKELTKIGVESIQTKKQEIYKLGDSRLMCGDSTVEADMLTLMNGEKADLALTDPPYILDYLKGKKKNKATEGFGYKRDRRYLETDVLPPDFTEKWMANINKIQGENFSIIVYENWKNIRVIWGEMEKYWKIKNMIVWHLPNRVQNLAAKYKFFNKHDIAMVGASDTDIEYNLEEEGEGLQEEYKTALYGIAGKPHWESYQKGGRFCPTDFIEYKASDEKSSGQGIIFGTKPVEILIPYLKVLTKRGDLVVEPFGGSGSTLIAATRMKRRCNIMEKSPVYCEVIINRWEKETGLKAEKLT